MPYCLISMKYTVARQSPRELRTGYETKFWHYCICISSVQCKRLVVLVGRKHVPSHKFGFIRVGCFIVCSQTPRGGSQQLMPPTTTSYNEIGEGRSYYDTALAVAVVAPPSTDRPESCIGICRTNTKLSPAWRCLLRFVGVGVLNGTKEPTLIHKYWIKFSLPLDAVPQTLQVDSYRACGTVRWL